MKTINIAIDTLPVPAKAALHGKWLLSLDLSTWTPAHSIVRQHCSRWSIPHRKSFSGRWRMTATWSWKYFGGTQCIFLNGDNVTEKIRTPEISMKAFEISALPEVRAFLLETQKDIAREFNVIMDGRDIGTVVLPDADLKIFLTASAEERASRRYLELEDKPDAPTYEQLLEEIRQRDYNDTHRKIAPLKCAKDAVRIDSTTMGFHEVCEEIMDLVEDRLDLE